jgi:hypothetical protein
MTYKLSTKWLYGDVYEPVFTSLAKLDQFYIDRDYARFSIVRIDDTWRTWSEMMQQRFPGYFLGSDMLIHNKSDISIDMDELLTLFRSKDLARYSKLKALWFGKQARFTTGKAVEQSSILYTTYPRSGNSLMRKHFENVTGIATGSDMVMRHGPNVALQFCGFKAEGIMDERVWIKKSHYPLKLHFQQGFKSDIAVICTRNPLDISPSYFYLIYTLSHVASFKEHLLDDTVWKYWSRFQKADTEAWNLWHNYWIRKAKDTEQPIYFFRFEDII